MKAKKTTRKPLARRLEKALREGIEHAKGERKLQTVTVPVGRTYTGRQVAEIRERYGYSQAQFAHVLATSVKTLQSWEQDARQPSKPTARLLQILDEPTAFEELFAAKRSHRKR